MLKAKGFSKATGKKLRRRVRWMRQSEGLKLNGGRRTIDLLFPFSHHKRLQSTPPVCFVSRGLLSLADDAADGGGVMLQFWCGKSVQYVFYKEVGGDALESLDDLRCRA